MRAKCHLVASVLASLCLIGTIVLASPAAAQPPDAGPPDLAIDGAARWIETGADGFIFRMAHSPQYDTLLVINDNVEAIIIDLNTGEIVSTHQSVGDFNDASVTPDGRYIFLAEDGRVGRDSIPLSPHHIHRYDIVTNRWVQLVSDGPANRVEAVSATRVLTTWEEDLGVAVRLQSFSSFNQSMTILSSVDAGDGGDLVFHAATGRVYKANHHADYEIHVLQLTGDDLALVEVVAVAGEVEHAFFDFELSPDGTRFFYGEFEFATDDLSQVHHIHDGDIAGATDDWAVFPSGALYRFVDGATLAGPTQWSPTSVFVSGASGEFFVVQPEFARVLHCQVLANNIGCPLAQPSAALCDGVMPTIDMNTNGGNGIGTAGSDVILGTPGDDFINGGGGDDLICAGDGDDLVWGGRGGDTVFGQGGADVVVGGPENDAIVGGEGDDVLHGSTGDDNLAGGDGDDRIFGYSGDDTISGDAGHDRLHGNFGNDNIFGGDGDDRMFGYGDNDSLFGDAGNDIMSGNFGDDLLRGGEGDDTIYGADGFDGLDGGPGNDRLFGNSLNDFILGGDGNDAIDGGIGTDECDGQAGTDTATRCEVISGVP